MRRLEVLKLEERCHDLLEERSAEFRSKNLEVGSKKLEVRNWMLEVRSRK